MEKQAIMAVDTKKQSTAVEVFDKYYDKLAMTMELSCNRVASSAFAAKLIDSQLMNKVVVKDTISQQEGTLHLLLYIGQKMEREPEQAEYIMKEFLAILNKELAYRHLVKKIGKS